MFCTIFFWGGGGGPCYSHRKYTPKPYFNHQGPVLAWGFKVQGLGWMRNVLDYVGLSKVLLL